MSIYVRDADGNRQKIAGVGLPGPPGKSAYQYAVEGGFTGTEDEFRALIGVHSNPNLLDNWYFADPINQRGQTEYTETGYTIDRWAQDAGITATITPVGLAISFSEVGGPRFCQRLEKYRLLEGSTYTISLLADVFNNNGVSVSLYQSSTGWNSSVSYDMGRVLVTKTFIVGNTDGELYATIGGTGQHITAIAAKLELGPVQTLAHKEGGNWVLNDPPPNKALELAKCQRYQVVINPQYLYAKFGDAVSHDVDMVFASVALPVPLRASPAIQVTNVNNIRFIRCGPTEAQIPITNVSLNSIIGNIMYLNIEAPGISVGDYGFMDFSGTDARIVLDANL